MSIGVLTKLAKFAQQLTNMCGAKGTDYMRYTPTGAGGLIQSLTSKLDRSVSLTDFGDQAAALAATMFDSDRFYLTNRDAFVLTVGTGGNCATINEAINTACRMRPVHKMGQSYCEIRLLSGFVMQEQVHISYGKDLGWIRITAVDPIVTIDPSFITQYLSVRDDSIPAFGAGMDSVLPVIGCKFQYTSNATAKDGVAVMRGSKVSFLPGAGVVRARRGLLVFYNSEAHCYPLGLTQGGDGIGAGPNAVGVDFSYARMRALHVAYGSHACLGRGDFSHCDGDFGVYVIWASYADCYHGNASYTLSGTGFHARDGSFLNCRESNYSHCQRGVHALHNGRINARSRINSETVGQWIGEGGRYCTQYAVLASNNSQVEAAELDASFCTGSAAVSASDASSVNFISGRAVNCTNRGVWSQSGSSISAKLSNTSGTPTGYYAEGAATIDADGGTATDCVNIGALALSGSKINIAGGNLSRCARGIEPRDGCEINARGATIVGCTDRAVSAIDGGRANVMDANLSNAALRAITCRGGEVVATRANCTGAGSWSVEVEDGGIVKFVGGVPGAAPMSVTPNTVNAAGIIFH